MGLAVLLLNGLRDADAIISYALEMDRRVLVMEYIDGIPILRLGDEMAKRGFKPSGRVAAAAKQ